MEENMKEAFVNAMITALEGGCNYWAEEVRLLSRVKGDMSIEDWFDSGHAIKVLSNDDYEETYIVGHDTFFERVNKLFPDWAEVFSDENDHDAEDADQFFQFGLFGEVVYG
jgi:hypothetical protein